MTAGGEGKVAATVKACAVRVFEIFGTNGTSLGLFRVESQWNGLLELRKIDGKSRVIGAFGDQSVIGDLIDSLLGGPVTGGFTPIRATEDIGAALGFPAP